MYTVVQNILNLLDCTFGPLEDSRHITDALQSVCKMAKSSTIQI